MGKRNELTVPDDLSDPTPPHESRQAVAEVSDVR